MAKKRMKKSKSKLSASPKKASKKTKRKKAARKKTATSGPSRKTKSSLKGRFQKVTKEIQKVEGAYYHLQDEFKKVAKAVAHNLHQTMTQKPKVLGKKFLKSARKDLQKVQIKLNLVATHLGQMQNRIKKL